MRRPAGTTGWQQADRNRLIKTLKWSPGVADRAKDGPSAVAAVLAGSLVSTCSPVLTGDRRIRSSLPVGAAGIAWFSGPGQQFFAFAQDSWGLKPRRRGLARPAKKRPRSPDRFRFRARSWPCFCGWSTNRSNGFSTT